MFYRFLRHTFLHFLDKKGRPAGLPSGRRHRKFLQPGYQQQYNGNQPLPYAGGEKKNGGKGQLGEVDDYQRLLNAVADMETAYRAETSHGNVGIYEVNNEKYGNYMIYYGKYNGRAREGQGHWLRYFEQNNYHAEGTWKEDKPNGYQEVREWNHWIR